MSRAFVITIAAIPRPPSDAIRTTPSLEATIQVIVTVTMMTMRVASANEHIDCEVSKRAKGRPKEPGNDRLRSPTADDRE